MYPYPLHVHSKEIVDRQESAQTYIVLQYLHRRVLRPMRYSNIYTGECSDLYGTPISTQESDQTYMVHVVLQYLIQV